VTAHTVFLFDVDNTLFDNDALQAELGAHFDREYGAAQRERYWAIFEELRTELGYADYLGALQRYHRDDPHDQRLPRISQFLLDYPFAKRLYPGALEALAACGRCGTSAILSDGDVVFQPHKVQRSGLWQAVGGRVLIYVHKERMLDDVARHYPAAHYVMADDKLRILTAMKAVWRERLTTVFVRQGHYARDTAALAELPPADHTVDHIAELTERAPGLADGRR
jgi:FMN phosphatase YigB (HAD superfamily)